MLPPNDPATPRTLGRRDGGCAQDVPLRPRYAVGDEHRGQSARWCAPHQSCVCRVECRILLHEQEKEKQRVKSKGRRDVPHGITSKSRTTAEKGLSGIGWPGQCTWSSRLSVEPVSSSTVRRWEQMPSRRSTELALTIWSPTRTSGSAAARDPGTTPETKTPKPYKLPMLASTAPPNLSPNPSSLASIVTMTGGRACTESTGL